jgi:hypothetical protein
LGVSSFGKINQKSIGAPVSPKALGFLIGPYFEPGDASRDAFAETFAPKVFIKQDGKLRPFRMLVYQGYRCLITMLFKIENESD